MNDEHCGYALDQSFSLLKQVDKKRRREGEKERRREGEKERRREGKKERRREGEKKKRIKREKKEEEKEKKIAKRLKMSLEIFKVIVLEKKKRLIVKNVEKTKNREE